MNTILVSVISDQTIPNLLVIKDIEDWYSGQLFITTVKMESEGKSSWIEEAAGLEPNSIHRIVVDENNWDDIKSKLNEVSWAENTKFVVNLTGGTKVMTLAIYEHFATPGNQIIYSPIGKNRIEELYPLKRITKTEINYRLSLSEYLIAYGLYFTSKDEAFYPPDFTGKFFDSFKNNRFNFYKMPLIIDAHSLADVKDKQYYSGTWFEEFAAQLLSSGLNLNNNQIAMNVKLFRNPDGIQHDNEFDIMFVLNNELYVIECKVSVGGSSTIKDKMDKYLYKLGAITKDFGLRVYPFIFTLTHLQKTAKNQYSGIIRRKEILGIKKIFDATDFTNVDEIIKQIKL